MHPSNPSALPYRADLDGLRGIAVLLVVLYHGGLGPFPGGYVGVDVFLVISGYLITRIILSDLDAGHFTLMDFYERRVRRLVPALVVMLTTVTVACLLLLSPQDLKYFGGSLFAAVGFAANLFFFLEAGYFDLASTMKPLLHTWSLAVEEQFYLLYPLLLPWLIRRGRRQAIVILAAVTAMSLLGSAWAAQNNPGAGFYLPVFRAWEIGVGALLALAHASTGGLTWPMTRLIALAGIASILIAAVQYDARTPFPGLAALLPCLGTAALLACGPQANPFQRALAWPALVRLGRLSYSWYLWHWPILVLARHYAIRELTDLERLSLLLLSLAIAALSWRWVERPFRGPNARLDRRRLLQAAIGSGALLACLGLAMVWSGGWPARYPQPALQLLRQAEAVDPQLETCAMQAGAQLLAGEACILGSRGQAPPSVVVWGDSQAAAMLPLWRALALREEIRILFLGKVGCGPLLDIERLDLDFGCRDYAAAAILLIDELPPDTPVILSARWTHYTDRPAVGGEDHAQVRLLDMGGSKQAGGGNDEALRAGLGRTLESLGDRPLLIIGTVPEIGFHVPGSLARAMHLRRSVDLRPSLASYRQRQAPFLQLLDGLPPPGELTFVDPAEWLCPDLYCDIVAGNQALYLDHVHLSAAGALRLAAPISRWVSSALSGPYPLTSGCGATAGERCETRRRPPPDGGP
ncbi:MAG: acyltransferase family protein [Steroidobacteraceae bacterium]